MFVLFVVFIDLCSVVKSSSYKKQRQSLAIKCKKGCVFMFVPFRKREIFPQLVPLKSSHCEVYRKLKKGINIYRVPNRREDHIEVV